MTSTALRTDALLLDARFRTPAGGPGAVEFVGVASIFDSTFGTAWSLGDPELLARAARPFRTARSFQDFTLLLSGTRGRIKSLKEVMDPLDPAMPRLVHVGLRSPLEITFLLPPAFISGYGALWITLRLIERVFTLPLQIKATQARLRAEIAEWEVVRSTAERHLLDVMADEIRGEPHLEAIELELEDDDGNSDAR